MNLLLDTHAFLWLDNAPAKLSPTVRALCQDPNTRLFLSVVSVWEIIIKAALGKLTLRTPLRTILADQMRVNSLQILPVTLDHVLAVEGLPLHHHDPFDRLLIAQALAEGFTVVSADPLFSRYPASLVW